MKLPKARQMAGGGILMGIGVLVGAMLTSAPGDAAIRPLASAALPGSQAIAAAPAPVLAKADATITTPQQAGYAIKSVLTIDGPLGHGNYYWDESNAPATGPLLITVDLEAQTLSVFRDGHEIGVAVILYGTPEKPTPLGAFPITQKDADHVSNLYDAPMPYMMRLTNDGVAIHGSDVEWGYGTRGCIGVPTAFAKMLFEQVKLGDVVIITNGQRINVGDAVAGV
ncbi:lipoprotein-anchoring transpeptidase ErfK/SrfK [Blastomonas natatoria]|uniref:Lipoprotein-anchoring transpeptidase ErfK/SrfK n=1 Tax=Blastomonas natatoria TaxID=34015 RepID=A0A2V3URY3_9SPHN|nr:L,D-transpeptidase family protein [Blastomonas natatoria]PXW70059.1 lipoprotein-anchoring transpeptidase ErfK/SrfK [Blastomonas natatoria]